MPERKRVSKPPAIIRIEHRMACRLSLAVGFVVGMCAGFVVAALIVAAVH